MSDTILTIVIVVVFIVGPFWLIRKMDKRVQKKGALFTGQATRGMRMLAILLGILFAGIFIIEITTSQIIHFVFPILALALIGYGLGVGQLLGKLQNQPENSYMPTRPSIVETTEQNMSDSEDPNTKLQSLLADIDRWAEKSNQRAWQDTIVAKTKKIHPSLPMKFYRNDREILGKINGELEKKWGLFSSTQSEKSFLDLIQVLDNLLELINS